MESKETGIVKWFNASKGFGFINRQDDESDIFVHYSQIKEKGFKSLSENDEVSFTMFEYNELIANWSFRHYILNYQVYESGVSKTASWTLK